MARVTSKKDRQEQLEKAGTLCFLRLGQLIALRACQRPTIPTIHRASEGPAADPAMLNTQIANAEQELVAVLARCESRFIRKAFAGGDDAGGFDLASLRTVSYMAYCQLCSNCFGIQVQGLARAVAQDEDDPGEILEIEHLCGRICARRILIYKDGHPSAAGVSGHLYLGAELLEHLGCGPSSELGLLNERKLQSLRRRAAPSSTDEFWNSLFEDSSCPTEVAQQAGETKDPALKSCSAKALFARTTERVIGIDEAARTLCARVGLHLQRASMLLAGNDPGTPNECLLFVGPSGSGKTHLAESVGRISGLPFGSISATDITCEGYVGLSIDDSIKPLIGAARGDLNKARFGICFIDEWDKKASDRELGRDVAGAAVQQSALRLMEGTEIVVGGRRSSDMHNPQAFNSRGTMFIFAGAFVGLDEILTKIAKPGQSIGFGNGDSIRTAKDSRLYDALQEFGMIPEFLNRLTGIIVFPEPTVEQLTHIATAPHGIIACYNNLLKAGGAGLEFDPESIRLMAEYAKETRTYARGLKSIVSKLVEDIVFEGASQIVTIGPTVVNRVIDSMRVVAIATKESVADRQAA